MHGAEHQHTSHLQAHYARLDKLTVWPGSSDTTARSTPDPATAYAVALSLFAWSPTQWTAARSNLLLHLLRYASDQTPPSSAASSSSTGGGNLSSWKEQPDEELWKVAFPMIRYFGLVQCLQRQLKGDSESDWSSHSKSR